MRMKCLVWFTGKDSDLKFSGQTLELDWNKFTCRNGTFSPLPNSPLPGDVV